MKKKLWIIACAALIAAMLSGCGNVSAGSAEVEDSTVSTGTTEISEENYHTYLMIYGGDLLVAHTQMLELIYNTNASDVDADVITELLGYCTDGLNAVSDLNKMEYPESLSDLHTRVLEYANDSSEGLVKIGKVCTGDGDELSAGLDQVYSGIQGIERCVDGTENLDADAILYEVDSTEDSSSTTSTSSTAKSTATAGQQNALRQAKNYLNTMPFSYSGLIKQLEYEGYTTEDATYGADNCGADWNEQAAKQAKNYMNTMSLSRSGLISQLEYEGFTSEQAEYGATAVGY